MNWSSPLRGPSAPLLRPLPKLLSGPRRAADEGGEKKLLRLWLRSITCPPTRIPKVQNEGGPLAIRLWKLKSCGIHQPLGMPSGDAEVGGFERMVPLSLSTSKEESLSQFSFEGAEHRYYSAVLIGGRCCPGGAFYEQHGEMNLDKS